MSRRSSRRLRWSWRTRPGSCACRRKGRPDRRTSRPRAAVRGGRRLVAPRPEAEQRPRLGDFERGRPGGDAGPEPAGRALLARVAVLPPPMAAARSRVRPRSRRRPGRRRACQPGSKVPANEQDHHDNPAPTTAIRLPESTTAPARRPANRPSSLAAYWSGAPSLSASTSAAARRPAEAAPGSEQARARALHRSEPFDAEVDRDLRAS